MKQLIPALIAAILLGVSTLAQADRDGEQVFKTSCIGCHLAGVAGAPKKGDAPAWQGRYGGDLDQLLASAIKGKGAMPPKGTCVRCTDTELRAAIEFMTR